MCVCVCLHACVVRVRLLSLQTFRDLGKYIDPDYCLSFASTNDDPEFIKRKNKW